jgi:hypothetical protein
VVAVAGAQLDCTIIWVNWGDCLVGTCYGQKRHLLLLLHCKQLHSIKLKPYHSVVVHGLLLLVETCILLSA